MDWTTFISSLVGSGATAWVLVHALAKHVGDRWLAEHKNELDKEFEAYRNALEQRRKRIEADLGHRVYVTQAQFDAEIKALKDIFAALGKLRLGFTGLRPEFSWASGGHEEKLEKLSRHLNDFKERYDALVNTTESLYPFVPENIYEQVQSCMKTATIEIMHIETSGASTFTVNWYEDGARQREKFTEAYYAAAKLTRERIRQLSVIS